MRSIQNLALISGLAITVSHAEMYQELVPSFSRTKSNVSIRKLTKATRSAIDFAAYSCNPVRFDPTMYKPKAPGKKVGYSDLSFNGYFTGAVGTLAETPLTEAEKMSPMAWKPLENKLWEITKERGWVEISANIEGYKWADDQIMRPYQEIAAVYVHGNGASMEVWIRLDFQPWVKFLKGITDKDKDGFAEVYGKIVLDKIPESARVAASEFIDNDYTKKVLNGEEILDWANVLASYWYPTLNTDIERTEEPVFPRSTTEPAVVKSLKGLKVANPVTVIKGDPFGKPIYNVFLVDSLAAATDASTAQPVTDASPASTIVTVMDTTVSSNFKANQTRLKAELKSVGTYDAWAKKEGAFLASVKSFLTALSPQQMGFKGVEDWVFFRKDLEFMIAGDLAKQSADKNPIPHLLAFQKFLKDNNANMLFVVCPNKSEVYFDKLAIKGAPKDASAIVNPYSRKFINDAQAAGIEVVDLLPAFLKAKAEDVKAGEPVYQKQDTHWTNRGLQIAAELISARIKEYQWYKALHADSVAYVVRDTSFERQGDIIDRLPEADRPAYPPVALKARRVYLPNGTNYKPINAAAPMMLIGDSFTGVFETVDCKSAGVGANIAARSGLPIEIITSWGGGPEVRDMVVKLAARRADGIKNKRLIVYMMVARDLYDYSRGWGSAESK